MTISKKTSAAPFAYSERLKIDLPGHCARDERSGHLRFSRVLDRADRALCKHLMDMRPNTLPHNALATINLAIDFEQHSSPFVVYFSLRLKRLS